MAGYSRPKMANFFFLFSLTFLFLEVNADACTPGCQSGKRHEGGFLAGHSYVYDFDGSTEITLSGADNQKTGASIFGRVTVYGQGECMNILKINDIHIVDSHGKKYGKTEDMVKPIKFTMQDGVISPEICAQEHDSQRSLNIKRAILSMLQTNAKFNTQVDIFGVCPSSYSVNGNDVTKTRDLNGCLNRESDKSDLVTYLYNGDSEIKGTNIMQADLRVDFNHKAEVVQKANAVENYFYRPFSAGSAGAKAIVRTNIALKGSRQESMNADCGVPKSIMFENPHEVNTEGSNLANIQNAVKTACQHLDGHVQPKSASLFTELIRILRVSNKDDIFTAYRQINGGSTYQNKQLATKVFLDALFRAGTGDSIEVCVKLLKNKQLNSLQTRLVLASLASVRHASLDSVNAVNELLDMPGLPNEVYLGAGALAGAYCRDHSCHGAAQSSNEAIVSLSRKFVSKIGDCKSKTKSDEDLIVFALKGIKNIKHIEDCVVDSLVHCASDHTVEPRVRVAALEAFSADPCIKELQPVAFKILEDKYEDSELRIKAYLALLNCPSAELVESVKRVLESHEPVLQVGSFITSSIKNIRASTNPSTTKLREYFRTFNLKKTYPLDPRKYSQAYEMSYNFDTLGVGSVIESNVIYSQNSFLPRSVNMNLTAEVFGKNVNLIEFGARQGNLDRILEEYFGPHGAVNTHTPQQMYNHMRDTTTNIYEKIQNRLKQSGYKTKRDVQRQVSAFGKKLKTDISGYKGNLDMDMFVKIFGSEAVFLSLGDDHPVSFESLIDRIFDLIEGGIDGAQKFSHEVRTNAMFLDFELAYPTASGLPLKLDLEGATSGKLTFGADMDLKQFLRDIQNAKIDIEVVPSASIQITGTLSVDADVFATGLKTVSTLQSSTGVHVVAKLLNGGNGFDMKVGLPVEKQELITATNEVVFFVREKGCMDVDKELKFDTNSYKQGHDCFDQLSGIIGLTLCTDYMIPQPSSEGSSKVNIAGGALFPLSGPAKVIVYLEKNDLRSFHLYGMNTETEGKMSWELSLEAQGAQKSRKVSTRLDMINQPGLYSLSAMIDSPIKVLQLSATAVLDDKEKTLTVKYTNDEDKRVGKIGVLSERRGGGNAYKPILEYTAPGHQSDNFRLDGTIFEKQSQEGMEFKFDGVCLIFGNSRFTLDGTTTLTQDGVKWHLRGAQGDNKATTNGLISFEAETGSHDIEIDFSNTVNPALGFVFKQNVKVVNDDTVSNREGTILLVHGDDPKSKTNAINYKAKCTYEESVSLECAEHLTYPLMGLEYKSGGMLKKDQKAKLLFDVKYGPTSAQFGFDFDDKMEKNTQQYGMMKCIINGQGAEIYVGVDEVGKEKDNYKAYVDLHPGGKYEISGTLKEHSADENDNIYLTACVKIPNKEDINVDTAFVSTKNTLDSHAKITQGSVCYLDYDTKIDMEKFSGSLKFILKDLVSANGHFAINPQTMKASADFTVQLPRVNKVFFLTSELLMEDPKYTGEMKLYTDYSKDKSQMYKLTTATIKKDDDIDSKNSFFYDNKQIKLNVKMSDSTKLPNNGFMKYYVDFYDSVGTVYNLGYSDVISTNNELINKNFEMTIGKKANEGAKPNKVVLKGKINDYNENKGTGSADVDLIFVKENGEDVVCNMQTMVKEKSGRSEVEFKTSLSGAMAPSELTYYTWLDFSDNDDDKNNFDMKYKIKGNYGVKTSFDGSGTFVQSPGQADQAIYKNDFDMKISLPVEKMQSIRITTKDISIIKEGEDDSIAVSSLITVLVNNEKYMYNCEVTMDDTVDKLKIGFDLPGRQPFVWDMFRKVVKNMEENKLDSEIKFLLDSYGDKYTFHSTGYRSYPDEKYKEYKSEITFPKNSKYGCIKKHLKMTVDSPNKHNIDFSVDVDGALYTINSNVDLNKLATSIVDIKTTCPNSKPGRLYIKSVKLSEHDVEGHAIVENYGDFNLDMMVNGKLNGADDFKIKVDINCPKFNAEKLHFEANNEPTGGAHKIQFFATENGNNVLSGVTTYHSKYEGQKFIMEGTGNVRVRGEQKTTSFKYIRDKKMTAEEKGVEVFFNVALGVKNVVVEFKDTNKAYKFTSVYCEEKKECAHVELISSSEHGDNLVSENFQVGFDLRKLGFAPEFGLQSKFEKQKGKLPIYNTDMHVTRGEYKYHTEMYGKINKGTYQTAFISSTPHRVISLETTNSYSQSGTPSYPLIHEAIFYLNKNDPRTKTHFKSSLDYRREQDKEVNLNGEIFFIYPGAEKDLQATLQSKYDIQTHAVVSNMNIDIFKKKNQKVVVEYKFNPVMSDDLTQYDASLHVVGRGLGLNGLMEEKFILTKDALKMSGKAALTVERQRREYSYDVDMNSNKQTVKATSPGGSVLSIDNEVSASGDKAPTGVNWRLYATLFGDMKYQFDGKVDASNGLVAEWNGGCLVTNEVLVLSAAFVPSKEAALSASYKENGRVHPLIKMGYSVKGGSPVAINSYNIENLKASMQSGATNLDLISKRAVQFMQQDQEPRNKFNSRILTVFKSAIPDFNGCRDYFKNEISAITQELKTDEFLKPIHANIEAMMQIVYTITENFLTAFAQTTKLITDTVEAFNEAFNSRILPALTETYEKLMTAALSVLNSFMDLAMSFVNFIDGIVKKHAGDWKPIMDDIQKCIDQALQTLGQWAHETQENIAHFTAAITKEIDEMPIVQMIKEKTAVLYHPDEIMETVNFIGGCFAHLVPTKEWEEFYTTLMRFIERKVRRQDGHDFEEIQDIIEKGSVAIDGIFNSAKSHVGANGALPLVMVYSPFSPESLGTLPKVKKPKISAANYAEDDIPSMKDLYQSYKLNSFDPEDLIPPYNMKGYIAGGQHVFTFDGRHMTFPGNCEYVVAQDAVDGNFSIILKLQDGQPKSVTLFDKSGNAVEVNTDGKLLLNGSPYGFPVIYSDTEAWKQGPTFSIKTKYGATVKCSNSLDLCYVKVSGYYYGKLRGLLGDGNNEPFDDFRLPNGKIADSESEFGNAYALTSGCSAVRTPDHSEHGHPSHGGHGGHGGHDAKSPQSGICSELFGEDSELSHCKLTVDVKNYKMACRHAVEAASSPEMAQSEACLIAKTYALACRTNAFPVTLPDTCIRCNVNGQSLDADDEMKVQSPSNQADIIITVETTRTNEKTYRDLVVPMMSSLVDELKKKKMNDINVYLVGLKPNFVYPIIYDVNDPKLGGCKISFPDQDRSTPWEPSVRTDNEVFDDYINATGLMVDFITTELGLDAMTAAFFGLDKLELRPKAAKSMIMVHSEPCPSGIITTIASATAESMMKEKGLTVHLISPMHCMAPGVKNAHNIVGFNEKDVFIVGDKKRGRAHPNLRAGLTYPDDECADFALSTFGNLYSSSNFHSLAPNQRKSFITLTSQTIADSMTLVTYESECKCEVGFMEVIPQVQCSVKSRKEAPAPKKSGKKK